MSVSAPVTYTGSAPGANTNDYVLFDTTVAFPGKRMAQGGGINKITVQIHHAGGDGIIKIQKSVNRGTSWVAGDTATVAAAVANTPHIQSFYIEPYDDFKVVWENSGGAAQTTWSVSIALVADL